MLARLRRPPRPLLRWSVRLVFTTALTTCALLADPPHVWAVADIPTVITNLRNWVVGILAGLATLFLTFGGLRYLMAGGDPGEVEAAKRALKAAAIGYGLAILAPVLVTVLQGIVGANDGGGGQ
ncbi:pilin [Streptomyces vastus]|uniref:TrbC/VIRB2 family protein n=1 Tax=Streptomyces vastus TaxID=285451 RepID=A0ABP6EAE2_9ACTN